MPVTDDRKAKKAAQAVHRDAFQASYQNKSKTTTTVSSMPHKTTVTTMTTPRVPTAQTFEEELRVKIEAEYEDVMQQALAAILARNERIAVLESDNEKLAMELSKIMVASVATPEPTTRQAQDKPGVRRCGASRNDGQPCQWNVAKSACRHHVARKAA